MSSSGEWTRAHHASISSGAQTLEARPPTGDLSCGGRSCHCSHSDAFDADVVVDEDANLRPINSGDLFHYNEGLKTCTSMAWLQEIDPCWRVVQAFHGQAWIALREMDREIIKATKGLVEGNGPDRKYNTKSARKLRRMMPERMAFVASLAALERLPQPSKPDVADFIKYFPDEEHEGRQKILPSPSPEHWKSLRSVTRQQRIASSLPRAKLVGEWLSQPFRRRRDIGADSEGNRFYIDMYKDRAAYTAVLIVCSVAIGVVVCVPIVILGMDGGSKGGKLVVVVAFIIFFGVAAALWLDDPAVALAVMIGFAASLVNVSV